MAAMRPPAVPEAPPRVLNDEQLRRLLKACEGREFADRRDAAILRLLVDTGMRRAEIAGLRVEDVDFDHDVAVVLGKGRRPRACPFGRKTAQALDRYLRVRAAHRDAALPALWLGVWGPMTPSGDLPDRPGPGGAGRASGTSTPTSSGTPSPTTGSPRAGRRAT